MGTHVPRSPRCGDPLLLFLLTNADCHVRQGPVPTTTVRPQDGRQRLMQWCRLDSNTGSLVQSHRDCALKVFAKNFIIFVGVGQGGPVHQDDRGRSSDGWGAGRLTDKTALSTEWTLTFLIESLFLENVTLF